MQRGRRSPAVTEALQKEAPNAALSGAHEYFLLVPNDAEIDPSQELRHRFVHELRLWEIRLGSRAANCRFFILQELLQMTGPKMRAKAETMELLRCGTASSFDDLRNRSRPRALDRFRVLAGTSGSGTPRP